MDEKRRELATNRLLEVIRSGKSDKSQDKDDTQSNTDSAVTDENITATSPLTESVAAPSESKAKDSPKRIMEILGKPTVTTKEEVNKSVKEAPRPVKIDKPIKKKVAIPKLKKVKGKTVYVIDIGTHAIKVMQVLKSEKKIRVIKAEQRVIPSAMRKNESGLKVLMVKNLREMLPAKDVDINADIYLTLPDQATQFKRVKLPDVNEKERDNAIKFQLKKELPFPLESCVIRYRGMNPKVKGRQVVDVLAVDQRVIQQRLDILSEAELTPTYITIPSANTHLLANYVSASAGKKGGFALVDIGAVKTTITITDQDRLILSRTISTGSTDFTTILQGLDLGANGVEFEEVQSEKYKLKYGLPPENDPNLMRTAILMRPVAERIASEINRSLDFYRREVPDGELQNVVLIGGGSQMKRLPEFLQQNLGIDVKAVNFNEMFDIDPASGFDDSNALSFGPLLAMALGNSSVKSGESLNFVPEEIVISVKLHRMRKYIAPVLIGATMFLIIIYTLSIIENNSASVKVGTIRSQLTDLVKHRTAYFTAKEEAERKASELAMRKSEFTDLQVGNSDLPIYLRAFSHLTPRNIYLTKLKTSFISEIEEVKVKVDKKSKDKLEEEIAEAKRVNIDEVISLLDLDKGPEDDFEIQKRKRPVFGKVIEVAGMVYYQGALTDVQLVDFVFSLENSGFFRDVAVDSATAQTGGNLYFNIICGI